LALVLVAVLLTLCAAELAARALAPHWAPQHAERSFWRHDALLGWSHRPGQRGTLRHPDFAVQVQISEQGFRDAEYPLGRVDGLRRMLVLGDSFAWGFGVERDAILWTRLELRHPGWEIINTAVSGYGTDQQLLFFQERGRAFAPDVVALHFHPNDLDDVAAARRYGYPKPHFTLGPEGLVLGNVPVPGLSLPWRTRRWLRESSYLFNRLQIVEQLLDAQGPRRLRSAGLTPGTGGPADGRAVAAALLARLDRACRDAGARLVVVGSPAPDDVRVWLGRTLSDLGVPYAPLDAAFRGRPRETYKFPNDPHWNAAGQGIAADAVEEFLVETAILP
jgi:hypothetical protein